VAHNPQSARLLAERVSQIKNTSKVHAIFSALKDKDILGLILPLKYCVNRWYPAQLEGKRAAEASQLLACFEQAEIKTQTCYNSPLSAFEIALKEAQIGDLIIVYGSFLTVSHVMTHHNLSEQKGN
jgi:dihydrofolate synthase/folylpolyglutamate synthase